MHFFHILESALQLVYASKESGGNPKSTASHAKVDEAAAFMQQAVVELTATLEKAGGEAGLISGERERERERDSKREREGGRERVRERERERERESERARKRYREKEVS